MADSSHPREAALVVNHSSVRGVHLPSSLDVPSFAVSAWFLPCHGAEESSPSQRERKILLAVAKTNCSDSPELPAQGVTGPD